MAQTIAKPCDRSCVVEITFCSNVQITVNGKTAVTIPSPERRTLRIDSGLFSVQNNTVSLRHRNAQVPTKITAAPEIGTVKLRYTLYNQTMETTVNEVQTLSVSQGKMELSVPSTDPPRPTEPHRPTPPQPSDELVKLNKLLAEKELRVKLLQKQVSELKTENKSLVSTTQNGLDQLLQNYQNGVQTASGSLNAKLGQLDQVRQQQAAITKQIEDCQLEIDSLTPGVQASEQVLAQRQQELAALKSQQEVTDLDCENATREIEALRNRLQMDGDLVALTESRWLKNNSVTDTLEEMGKKIEAMEDRISFILNAREAYGRAVQAAILRDGDGTVSLRDESGNTVRNDPTETDG